MSVVTWFSESRAQGPRPWARLAGIADPIAILGVIVAAACWYGASALVGPNMPTPDQVIRNAYENLFSSSRLPGIGLPRGGYFPHLMFTTYDVLLGGGVGAAVGVATGLASAESRVFAEIVGPVVTIMGTIPIVILAPFFLMWFGLSGIAQIALVSIYTATVLHLFTFRGANNLSPRFMDYGATLGASPLQRFIAIRLPGTLPEVFGGLRIAFAADWGLAAVTEMLGGQFGSGRVIVALRSVYDLTGILAIVLLLAVLAVGLDGAILAIRRYALRWAAATSSEARSA